MLEPQVVNFIATPLIAGVVGYVTNKLAIKMLFRPYKAKWYTLGWQGIVPKTRPYLAQKISEVVGQKLLAHDDFLYAIESSDVKESISKIIASKLVTVKEKDIHALLRLGRFEDKIISNKDYINSTINSAVSYFIEKLLDKKVDFTIFENSLISIIEKNNYSALKNIIYENILSFIDEDKKICQILPEKVLENKSVIVDLITESVMAYISSAGNDNGVKIAVAEKIIHFKQNYFSQDNNFSFIKSGILEIFLSDEKIIKSVFSEMPAIMNDLSKNEKIKNSIRNHIEKEIDKILESTVAEVEQKFNLDIENSVKNYIDDLFADSSVINKKINNLLTGLTDKYSNLSIKEIIKELNIDIINIIKIDVQEIINSDDYKSIKRKTIKKIINYINENYNNLSQILSDILIKVIKSNLKYALNALNIEKIVKDKINALPLQDVEDILFSFMKTHFKWINILGFILGFLIGLLKETALLFI